MCFHRPMLDRPGRVSTLAAVRAIVAIALSTVALDLVFIGGIAARVYAELGALKRATPFVPAAVLFYGMYVGATYLHAVRPSASPRVAARRGAALGFVAYATYELTNWAVLRDWPALVVPVDIAWGVVLTSATAAMGRVALGAAASTMHDDPDR